MKISVNDDCFFKCLSVDGKNIYKIYWIGRGFGESVLLEIYCFDNVFMWIGFKMILYMFIVFIENICI